MAIVYATKTGNWSDTTVWSTGGLPTSTDDVYANNFTVTINQNVTVLSLRTSAGGSAVAGGGFSVSASGLTINATTLAGTSNCLTISATGTTILNGDATGGASSNTCAITLNSSGTLTYTGNASGNSGNSTLGIQNTGSGTINMVGNCMGGSATSAYGIQNQGAGSINVTGNATGGNTTNAYGAANTGLGTITISGNAIGGTGAAGIVNTGSGTLRVTRAIASSGTNPSFPGLINNGISAVCVVSQIEFGSSGQIPVSGFVKFDNAVTIVAQVRRENNTNITLVDASNTGLLPTIANVRSGTVYNSGNLTGTLAVPNPANVRVGVATDNTLGTAALSPADLWNVLTTGLTTTGSIGERLKNTATVQSTGDQIAALNP